MGHSIIRGIFGIRQCEEKSYPNVTLHKTFKIKGIVHPKVNITPRFTHPQANHCKNK